MPEQRSYSLLTALVVLLAGVSGACASGGKPGNAAATAASTAELRSEVAEARTVLQQLSATLYETDQPETLNGGKWFKRFSKQHERVREAGQTLREGETQYAENRRLYLNRWEDDLSSILQPELREASAKRRDVLRADLRRTGDGLEAMTQDFEPLLRTLGDLEAFLVNDLTANAFVKARPQLTTAWENCNALVEDSADVLDDLNGLVDELKPVD